MDFLLFLGSGTSIPSGFPSTEEITQSLLQGDWNDKKLDSLCGEVSVPCIQALLDYLLSEQNKQLNLHCANYETLYYLIDFLHQELEYPSGNIAVSSYFPTLQEKMSSYFPVGARCTDEYLKQVLESSLILITHVVREKLTTIPTQITGLDLLKNLAKSPKITKLDIVTLNHDLLVENLFNQDNINYFDGFGAPDGEGLRYFELPFFFNTQRDEKISLLKLHGSLNWFSNRDNYRVYIPSDGCIPQEQFPIFLSGSKNKALRYTQGIYAFMHNYFLQTLYQYDTILMSGYGWNDENINSYFFNWLATKDNRKIRLLYANEAAFVGIGYHRADNFKDKLILTGKWLCDTTLGEVLQILN